jgi:hypothetical protein
MAQGVGLGTHRCQLELETVPSAVCSTADLVRPRVAQRRHWAPTAQSRHWPRLRPLGTRPANIHQPVCSARRAGFPASSVLECTPTGRESFPARVAFPPAPALGTLGARRCRRHRPLGPRPEDIYRPAFLARRADVRAASLFLARRAGVRTASSALTRRVANHKSSLVSRTRRVANHESSFSRGPRPRLLSVQRPARRASRGNAAMQEEFSSHRGEPRPGRHRCVRTVAPFGRYIMRPRKRPRQSPGLPPAVPTEVVLPSPCRAQPGIGGDAKASLRPLVICTWYTQGV